MPLTNDVAYYDMQARMVMSGGVLYRDMLEPNLPGMVWMHMAVRSVVGWSTEALRGFDFVVMILIAGLCGQWVFRGTQSSLARIATATIILLTYVSMSEWCHVQRDVWMLVPALIALFLRKRQSERLCDASASNLKIFSWSLTEGICLGCAVWIKPHIVVPGFCVWLVSILGARWKKVLIDLGGLLLGGITMGALGILWLVQTGAWPWFQEMMLEWNPEYVQARGSLWTMQTVVGLTYRLLPYWMLHVIAIPVAFLALLPSKVSDENSRGRRLFSTLYLGWCFMVLVLQHPFDYVHLPPILLAVVVLADWVTPKWNFHAGLRLATFGFLTAAFAMSPVKDAKRLKRWPQLITEGSTFENRNALAKIVYPDWEDVARIERFLQQQNAGDGDITCSANDLVHVYRDLNLKPSTRFVYVGTHLFLFPTREREIKTALNNSHHKYVIANIMAGGLTDAEARVIGPAHQNGLPPKFPNVLRTEFPWNLPIVFRAGTLTVHRVPPGYQIPIAQPPSPE